MNDLGINKSQVPVELTLDQPVTTAEAKAVVQYGQALAKDGLSVTEKKYLEEQIQLLIDSPNLPEPDKQALANWKKKIEGKESTTPKESTVDLFDPKVYENLLSNNPQTVLDAFNALGNIENHVYTPEQKALLKEGVSKIATKLANIKSGDPKEVKQEIEKLLKEAFKDILTKDGKPPSDAEVDALVSQYGKLLDEVADNLSILNFAHQNTLSSSTKKDDIYQALLSDSNLMFHPPGEIVMKKLDDIAQKIADANKLTTPNPDFGSQNPAVIADKLRKMMNLQDLPKEDSNYQTLSELCDDIANAIAQGNASKQKAIDSGDAHSIALMVTAKAVSSGGADSVHVARIVAGDTEGTRAARGVGGPPPPPFLNSTPPTNPYLTPGIMARLAPILSELQHIYTEIIKQSSKLKQNMMELATAMAKEAFTFALAAGQARVDQLQVEIKEATANIVMASINIVASVSIFGVSAKARSEHQNNWMKANDKKTAQDYYKSPEYKGFSTSHHELTTLVNNVKDQLTTVGQNIAKLMLTPEKMKATMDEATAKGMEQLVEKLLQTVMDTMRTAGEEGQRAERDWQAFNQLWREMASTITQSIYR